jgi:hypothetical protein
MEKQTKQLKVLELFSGTASFSNVAKKRGHKVFTIDFDKTFNPDLCIDILDFDISMLPEEFKHPDIIWASPPCTTFSVASLRHYWDKGKPKNEKALKGIEIVKKTREIIKKLNPKFYIIENPRGMLRKQEFMQDHKDTVTYCQYGLEYQKATDLWNNLNHTFKPMCSPKSPCHVRSPRGSKMGIQGVIRRGGNHPDWNYTVSRAATLRGIVPKELCLEIIKAIEQ